MVKVFISHAHDDAELVSNLSALLDDIFVDRVQVYFSSSTDEHSGIPAGAEWLPWIVDRIKEADVTIIMLTPLAIQKPWVLWESGAVSGVAFGTEGETSIIPALFGVGQEAVPDPLRIRRSIDAETREGIEFLLETIHSKLPEERKLGHLDLACDKYIPGYLNKVAVAVEHIRSSNAPKVKMTNPFKLSEWGRSLFYPLSVIKIGWNKMSFPEEGKYLVKEPEPGQPRDDDIKEDPWIYDGNQELLDFYAIRSRDNEIPGNTLRRQKLTFAVLVEKLQGWMSEENFQAFGADQMNLRDEVIFKDLDAQVFRDKTDDSMVTAQAPMILNETHPTLGGKAFLPCLLAKRHDGDFPNGEHSTYLLVAYVDVTGIKRPGAPVG